MSIIEKPQSIIKCTKIADVSLNPEFGSKAAEKRAYTQLSRSL